MTSRDCRRLIETMRLDPRMRLVSMAARGLWLALADALLRLPDPGVGRLAGRVLSVAELGLLVNADRAAMATYETQETEPETQGETKTETGHGTQAKTQLETWIEELVGVGLAAREADGAVSVEVPVSHDARAVAARQNGSAGGRPRRGETAAQAAARRQGNLLLPVAGDRAAKTQAETDAPTRTTTTTTTIEETTKSRTSALALMDEIAELARLDPARGLYDATAVTRWLSDGIARETILAVVRRVVSRDGYDPRRVRTLKFFDPAIRDDVARAEIPVVTASSAPVSDADRAWLAEMRGWQANGCVGESPKRRKAA